jgi:hypothetical protein
LSSDDGDGRKRVSESREDALLSSAWRRSPRAGAEPKGEEKAGAAFSAGGGGSNSDNAGPPNGEESMMECGGGGGRPWRYVMVNLFKNIYNTLIIILKIYIIYRHATTYFSFLFMIVNDTSK